MTLKSEEGVMMPGVIRLSKPQVQHRLTKHVNEIIVLQRNGQIVDEINQKARR